MTTGFPNTPGRERACRTSTPPREGPVSNRSSQHRVGLVDTAVRRQLGWGCLPARMGKITLERPAAQIHSQLSWTIIIIINFTCLIYWFALFIVHTLGPIRLWNPTPTGIRPRQAHGSFPLCFHLHRKHLPFAVWDCLCAVTPKSHLDQLNHPTPTDGYGQSSL